MPSNIYSRSHFRLILFSHLFAFLAILCRSNVVKYRLTCRRAGMIYTYIPSIIMNYAQTLDQLVCHGVLHSNNDTKLTATHRNGKKVIPPHNKMLPKEMSYISTLTLFRSIFFSLSFSRFSSLLVTFVECWNLWFLFRLSFRLRRLFPLLLEIQTNKKLAFLLLGN